MPKTNKTKRVDIYSRGKERLKMLEEAGRTHGKSPQEIKDESDVDAVFEQDVDPEPESKDWWDQIFGD